MTFASNLKRLMNRLQPGIELRLLLLGVLPAALIAALLTSFFVRTRVADLDMALKAQGDVIVRQLASASVHGIFAGNTELLQDIADAALQENNVAEVTIFNQANVPLATAKRGDDGARFGGPDGDLRLTFVAPVLLKPVRINPAEGSDPLPSPAFGADRDNLAVGSVSVSLSNRWTLQSKRDTILYSLRIAVAGLLLTAFLAYRMGRRISSPILALTDTVHALSQGNLDARARYRAVAELDALREGFNAMADELQRGRDTLEFQVAEATRQLQKTLERLEKRNLEADAARRQAEAQTELKSQFLAQMSHEIRTPMNGIIGFTELIRHTPLNPDQAEKLNLIERSAKNLLTIINEILDLAKLEAGKVTLNRQWFLLRSYLEDSVALLTAPVARVPVILWIAPTVPRHLFGDPVRLQQIVNNLLSNALKSTFRGQIVLRVRLIGGSGAEQLMISVSDTGAGIAEKDLDSLFSPFLQISEYAINHERGAGLGLTIARNIVERMNGRIHVASRVGRGSVFWFGVPIVDLPPPRSDPVPERGAVSLVDAGRLSGEALQYQLQALGYRVQHYRAVSDLMAACAGPDVGKVLVNTPSLEQQPDVALVQLLRQTSKRGDKVLLILPTDAHRQQAYYRQLGATCLSHPVRSETLRAALFDPAMDGHDANGLPMANTATNRGRRFLIVDDNEINRLLLRAQLSKTHAVVVEARDGAEALTALLCDPFDLVFMDLQMPVMSGLEVLDALQGQSGPNRGTPMVAITAHAQPQQKQALLSRGFADCLIKPILEDQITIVIDRLLGKTVPDTTTIADSMPDRSAAPETVEGAAAPSLDVLLERSRNNRELALSIATKLFGELKEQWAAVESAIGKHDHDAAAQIAHRIHGSASFCGLEALRLAARDLETCLLSGASAEQSAEARTRLGDQIKALLDDADALLASLKEPAAAD